MLRSSAKALRLEAWPHTLAAILRDAVLRTAPQDEVGAG
jgi:hypothetical protein